MAVLQDRNDCATQVVRITRIMAVNLEWRGTGIEKIGDRRVKASPNTAFPILQKADDTTRTQAGAIFSMVVVTNSPVCAVDRI